MDGLDDMSLHGLDGEITPLRGESAGFSMPRLDWDPLRMSGLL